MSSRLLLLATIQLARVHRAAGSEVEIDDEKEAQRLVETKQATYVAESPVSSTFNENQKAFAALSAKDAIEFAGTVATTGELLEYMMVERGRKAGERKTVVDAINARGDSLYQAEQAT